MNSPFFAYIPDPADHPRKVSPHHISFFLITFGGVEVSHADGSFDMLHTPVHDCAMRTDIAISIIALPVRELYTDNKID